MKAIKSGAFLSILSLIVCVVMCAFSMDDSLSEKEKDSIRESVFKYMFQNNFSRLKNNANAYYLSLSFLKAPNDPGDALLARFRGYHPTVKKVSSCTISTAIKDLTKSNGMRGVSDNVTGDIGMVFFITNINLISDIEVEVEGGYYENALSSSMSIYKVKKENAYWVVKSSKLISIS